MRAKQEMLGTMLKHDEAQQSVEDISLPALSGGQIHKRRKAKCLVDELARYAFRKGGGHDGNVSECA